MALNQTVKVKRPPGKTVARKRQPAQYGPFMPEVLVLCGSKDGKLKKIPVLRNGHVRNEINRQLEPDDS